MVQNGPTALSQSTKPGNITMRFFRRTHGPSIFSCNIWVSLRHPQALAWAIRNLWTFYYTEYKHEEKKGRNAKGADTFNLCTDRKHECSCEFYDGKELKDCLENRVEHCSSTFDCNEWMKVNKCTLSTEQTMKLMHKNSNMRIGTCFDKKQLKTRMMMAQCPDGYEKCDCNNKC